VGDLARKASPFLGFVPGVGTLAAAGIGLGGSLLGRLNDGGGAGSPTATPAPGSEAYLNNRYIASLTGMGNRGEAAEAQYVTDLNNFDPTAGFAEQTDAELAAQNEDFARRYGDSLGRMVGQGRLPTRSGFGVQDTQDLIKQGQRERAAIEQRNAAAASQAQAQKIREQGAYAMNTQNRYFDALGGRRDTLEAQRLQDEAERRRGRAGLLGGVLQAGATLGGAYLAGRKRVA
jgi:hypothetical protein